MRFEPRSWPNPITKHGWIPWNKKGGTEYGTHTRASNASSFRNMGYLRDAKSRMENSLLRISSGKKILSAADDPGGLALSMRLIQRTVD